MLTYKIKGTSKFVPINIPYDDDTLYVSPDKTWISGTCDLSAEMFDEQTVYISNGTQFIESTAYTENVLRQGYVIVKESSKVYKTTKYNFDGDEMEIHYIRYNNRYFFEDLSGISNIDGNVSPTGEITMFKNDTIRKPVEVSDKEYADVETILYIENGAFTYKGKIYSNDEDFNLEPTIKNHYNDFIQTIYFDDGNIGEIHVFEVENYIWKTRFKIELSELEPYNVKNAQQVGMVSYAPYKNQLYPLLGEEPNTYIMTDSGRVDNFSTDMNYFVPEDESYLCTEVCKYKFAVKTSYAPSEAGNKVLLIFDTNPNLSTTDSIQYKSKNIVSERIYVYSDGNDGYYLFLNDMTYQSELNRLFFIKIDDVDYQLTMSNIVDDDVPNHTIGYIDLHGAPAEIYVSDDYTTYQRYVAKDGKFSMENGEIENRATFNINDNLYPVFTEKKLASDGTEVELYYIEYQDYLFGELDVVEILSDTVIVCSPKCNYESESIPDFNDKVYQSNFVANYFRNLLFSRANDVLTTPSLNDFSQSEPDAEDELNTDDFTSKLAIIKNGAYLVLPIQLGNGIGNNLLQQDIVTNQFYEVEREKSINSIVDMEKDVYHPCVYDSELNDCKNPENLTEVTEIIFNLHLRTRNMDTWEVNEEEGTGRNIGLTNWFITDYPYYFRKNDINTVYENDVKILDDGAAPTEIIWNDEDKPDDSPKTNNYEQINSAITLEWKDETKPLKEQGINLFETSDLLYFMKFDDDDIFYQKSKVAKTFLRLSFYDSPNPKTQSLLYYSTIFLDEGDLFKKYINNTKTRDGKEFIEVCRLGYENMSGDTSIQFNWSECSGNASNSISVSREYVPRYDEWGEEPDITKALDVHDKLIPKSRDDKRLGLQFKVTNRYQTDDSSDGFYVYIFKDFTLPFKERSIYMKVELNHAGLGKTIQFMYPRVFSTENENETFTHLTVSNAIAGEGNDAKKYEIDPNNAYLVLSDDNSKAWNIKSKLAQNVSQFRQGYDLQDIYYQQYIEFKVIYDNINKRFCYYLPFDNDYGENVPYRGTKMILNLWELKIKNDLTETDEA